MEENILEMRKITKEFPGVKALDQVSFQVRRGEIKGLVGENGAGKSTLMDRCVKNRSKPPLASMTQEFSSI